MRQELQDRTEEMMELYEMCAARMMKATDVVGGVMVSQINEIVLTIMRQDIAAKTIMPYSGELRPGTAS